MREGEYILLFRAAPWAILVALSAVFLRRRFRSAVLACLSAPALFISLRSVYRGADDPRIDWPMLITIFLVSIAPLALSAALWPRAKPPAGVPAEQMIGR